MIYIEKRGRKAKLTDDQKRAIVRSPKSMEQLAVEYGVPKNLIYKTIKNRPVKP